MRRSAAGAAATLAFPQIVSAALAGEPARRIRLEKGDVILFQGDSITDWGRARNNPAGNETGALGSGYALLASSQLLLKYPARELRIYNRGVGGDRVQQLAERWEGDTLAVRPSGLSIHIGVNDCWAAPKTDPAAVLERYAGDYRTLIARTKASLPDVRIVICEPFALKGVKVVDDSWYPAFDLFRKAARNLASDHGLPFVPWQGVFDKALDLAPAPYWSLDGVHPSLAGEALMAQAWLETVGL